MVIKHSNCKDQDIEIIQSNRRIERTIK